jgi:DNA anti-recombination protein RmuC
MTELLQLTSEQETRFRQIMAESRKQLSQLQHEQAPKIEAIRAETNRKLTAILNAEQQEKFESFVKEIRRRHLPGGRQFGPPMRPMEPLRDERGQR